MFTNNLHLLIKLSEAVTNPAGSKTGRESFRFIWLLNSLVVVIYTSSTIIGRFYIVTRVMEELETVDFILSALSARDEMVDFQ